MLYAHTVFEADDIIQESFLRIYTHLRSYKHEGSFEGWVRRIIVNTALNMRKARKNINNIMDPLEEVHELEVGYEFLDPLEAAEPSQLLQLIESLPEGYKIVFSLYVFEDFSHKEIAHQLEISEATSRSQYAKAKKFIINLMERQRNGDNSFLYNKGSI
jgi:RNA polymerase sigma-70 factor (ECF subfamily)